jgi:hypothetical protein
MRVLLVGASLLTAAVVLACSDDGGEDGANGGATVSDSASPTSTPANETPGSAGSATTPEPPSAPASDEPPVTTASANGQTVETGIGTYCWTLLCVDKIGVPTKGALTVSAGDTVSVAIPDAAPAPREASANVFEAVDAQALDDGSEIWPYPGNPGESVAYEVTADSVDVTVDLAPGRYVLAVGMFFEAGDVVYGVLIEVQ